ncbi:MAG: DUF1631 domain-containing protein [Aquisalinus sp.]|nr:DUF1631 domain-containing protein [Aquisalinus sp.]
MSGFNKIHGGNPHGAFNMHGKKTELPTAKGHSLFQQLQQPHKGTGSVYAQSNQFHGNDGGTNDIMALLKLLMSMMQKSGGAQQGHGATADQAYQPQGKSGNNDMMALIQLLLSFMQKSSQGGANAQGHQPQSTGGSSNDMMALLQLLQSFMQKSAQGGSQGNGFPHMPQGHATGNGAHTDNGYQGTHHGQSRPHPFSQIGEHQPQICSAGNDNGDKSGHC